MALLQKRPLAVACIFLVACTVAAFFLAPSLCFVLAAVAGTAFLLLLGISLWRGYRYSLLCLLLIFLFASGAFLRTGLYQRRAEDLQTHIGQQVHATLTVREVRYSNAYAAELVVEIDTLNDEAVHADALLSLDYASPFYSGDTVSGEFTVQSLSFENYYATQQYHYMAEGCRIMLLGSEEAPPILCESGKPDLKSTLTDWRIYLSQRLTHAVSGESGQLLAAMLLGEREALGDTLTRDFGRAGVAHLLALSGLHVGILALLVDRLLSLFSLGKRWRVAVTMLFLCLYLLMTGGALSTLRAVLMLGTVYLAFACQARADPLTALCLAAALIVCVQPYAVFSVSFQMTVLATLGILAYSSLGTALLQRLGRAGRGGRKRLLYKGIGAVAISLLISLSAGFAVLPVQWYAFGTLSAVTPLANLLLLPLATPYLLLGLATLFLFPGTLFAACVAHLGNLMLALVRWLAAFDAVFSLRYTFVPYILWPLVGLTVLFLLIDLKKRRFAACLPMLCFVLAFTVGVCVTHAQQRDEVTVSYRVSGKQEGIVCTSAGRSLVIDLSGGSYTQLNGDWQLASDACATEIDVLCLTHYHSAHTISFARLASSVTVRQLWVPAPTTAQEAQILQSLFENARACGTAVVLYDYDTPLSVFSSFSLTISLPLFESRSTEPVFALTLSGGEQTLYYESAAYAEYAAHVGEQRTEVAAAYYIVGAHGPVPHEDITPAVTGECTVLLPSEAVITHFPPQAAHTYVVYPAVFVIKLQ